MASAAERHCLERRRNSVTALIQSVTCLRDCSSEVRSATIATTLVPSRDTANTGPSKWVAIRCRDHTRGCKGPKSAPRAEYCATISTSPAWKNNPGRSGENRGIMPPPSEIFHRRPSSGNDRTKVSWRPPSSLDEYATHRPSGEKSRWRSSSPVWRKGSGCPGRIPVPSTAIGTVHRSHLPPSAGLN